MLKTKLALFYFFYFALIGVYIIFLPKVLYELGYTTSSIGIILSIAALMRFVTPFLFLKLFDLNKKIFILALIFTIASIGVSYYTIYQFYLYFITSIIFGLSISLILPFVETIALEKLDKDSYGKIRLFGSIGFMLIALGVSMYEFNTTLVINYLLILSILISITAYQISNFDLIKPQEDNSSFSIIQNYKLWVSLFLMQLSFGAYYNFFTIYETDHGISIISTSYLWSVGVIAEVLMLYFQGSILKKYPLITLIKLSTLLTALRWFLTYLFASNIIMLYFIQTIHAFSFALYHTSVIMYLFSIYKNKKLAQQFFLGIAYGLGGAVGAIVAGEFYGEYLFLSSAFFALLSYILIKR